MLERVRGAPVRGVKLYFTIESGIRRVARPEAIDGGVVIVLGLHRGPGQRGGIVQQTPEGVDGLALGCAASGLARGQFPA